LFKIKDVEIYAQLLALIKIQICERMCNSLSAALVPEFLEVFETFLGLTNFVQDNRLVSAIQALF
jgi:hypothetical protein